MMQKQFYGGYDPGGKQDPGAFIVVQKDNDLLKVVLVRTYLVPKGSTDSNVYTRFTAEIADVHKRLCLKKLLVDETGIGQPIIEHCKELKLPAEGMTLTAHSKEELLSNLKILLEQKKIMLPADNLELLANLNCIQFERSRAGGYIFSHPQGTHDDLAYALALACWAASGRTAYVAILKAEKEKSTWRQGL